MINVYVLIYIEDVVFSNRRIKKMLEKEKKLKLDYLEFEQKMQAAKGEEKAGNGDAETEETSSLASATNEVKTNDENSLVLYVHVFLIACDYCFFPFI